MKDLEYIFNRNGIVHVIKAKYSQNTKLGYGFIITTYHFAEEQVIAVDMTKDAAVCFGCPFSYNQNGGKSGGCYTHRHNMSMGLKSMLIRLHKIKGSIKDFSNDSMNTFLDSLKGKGVVLARFGGYGEPVTLPLNIVGKISRIAHKHTGYTHAWRFKEVGGYAKYFMASTHSEQEKSFANILGWRAFNVKKKGDKASGAICPASKEFKGNKKSCIECGACDGVVNKKKNNINIFEH